MEYTVDEVMKYIEEEDAKFIRLAFRDAFGVQKNISVMPGEVKKAFEHGVPINARASATVIPVLKNEFTLVAYFIIPENRVVLIDEELQLC